MVQVVEVLDVGTVVTRPVHALEHLDTGVLVTLQLQRPPYR